MNQIKKNYIYNSIYQIILIIIPIITTPYLTRTLGADGIGIYSYNYSVANYFVLFIMLGINNYGNREIAKVRDSKHDLSLTFWNMYIIQFVLGVTISILYILYSFFLSENIIYSIVIIPYVISGALDINWFFFGLEKFKLTIIRNFIIKFITTVMIFLLINSNLDVWKYCLIMTGGMLISQIVVWPYAFRIVGGVCLKWELIKNHIIPNLYLFLTVVAVSLFKIMDKIMLGLMTNTIQVGFYESSEKIIAIPIAFISSLGTVMLPRMSNLAAKKADSTELLEKSIMFAMFLSTSLCFGIMAVSKEFVPLFYGDGFEICKYLYLILLPSSVFLAFANVIRSQYLLPHQMDRPYVISAFLGAGINLLLNICLIPEMDALGAAFGTLGAEAVVCIYQSYAVHNVLPINRYTRIAIPFIVSGICMFLITYWIDFEVSMLALMVIKILVGILVYFITLAIVMRSLNQETWNKCKSLFKDLMKRG